MEIVRKGIEKQPEYIGQEASCKTCHAVGRIEKKDIREIKLRGAFKRPMIKCSCGGWMLVGVNP